MEMDKLKQQIDEAFKRERDKDLTALNDLVEEYTNKETELMKVENELATRDEQFANFITTQKRLKEQREVLNQMIREEMEARGLTEHETDTVILKLSPLGKYKADNLDNVPDDLCKVVRSLDNSKVKAYLNLNGKLPDGVESLGSRLTIRVKEDS